MFIEQELTLKQKLEILSDAAKYDAACTSSGIDRAGQKGALGSTSACGICHSFTQDGRCVSLLKILLSNECAYDCAYCINRCSNDIVRATFSPEEICTLTMEFYRRNYIEGLFLSSGVLENPTHTMALMWQTIYMLRHEYQFYGYIHVKAIPGADPAVIEELGYLADRMSVNLELPTADGLRHLAPAKTRKNILTPMRQIQQGIGMSTARLESTQSLLTFLSAPKHPQPAAPVPPSSISENSAALPASASSPSPDISELYEAFSPPVMQERKKVGYVVNGHPSRFAPAGQSTQMIIGATNESDYQIMAVSEALYKNYGLKRVFYSAFIRVNDDPRLPALSGGPPLLREHRLYQADWLLRCYGFEVKDLLNEKHPNFDVYLDPKCDWALQHMELFPVEINHAPYSILLRVPGIGVKSASRIVQARRSCRLDFPQLKRMGVVLKRAHFFITCSGRMMMKFPLNPDFIARQLRSAEEQKNWQTAHPDSGRQLSLFDDFGLARSAKEDAVSVMTGQL